MRAVVARIFWPGTVSLRLASDELSSSGELGEESSTFDMGGREKRIEVRLKKIFLMINPQEKK